MKPPASFTLTFVLAAAVSLPAFAQQAAPAPTPTPTTAAAHECPKATPRHDHGAERHAARVAAKAMPCGGDTTTAPAATKKPSHDHRKFHKNM